MLCYGRKKKPKHTFISHNKRLLHLLDPYTPPVISQLILTYMHSESWYYFSVDSPYLFEFNPLTGHTTKHLLANMPVHAYYDGGVRIGHRLILYLNMQYMQYMQYPAELDMVTHKYINMNYTVPRSVNLYTLGKTTVCEQVILQRACMELGYNVKPFTYARCQYGLIITDECIYVVGGRGHPKAGLSIEKFDGIRWTLIMMPSSRSNPAAVVLDNKIYVIGGRNKKISLTRVDVYNLHTKQWSVTGSLRKPKQNYRAVVMNQTLYCLGDTHSPCEVYNPQTQTWSDYLRLQHSSVNLQAGFVYDTS